MATDPRTGNFIRPLAEPQWFNRLFDDFHGDTFATGTWDAVSLAATGGTDFAYDAAAGNPANSGWVAGTTGTGDNDAEAIFGPLNWMANRATSEFPLVFEARINLPSVLGVGSSCGLTDARTESAALFSLATTTWTTTPDDAVAWSYDTDATTDLFRGIGVKATVDTAAVVGALPVLDTPLIYRIELDSVGGAYFYQNHIGIGYKAAAVTTTVALCPFFEVTARAGSAAKAGECDYILVSCAR